MTDRILYFILLLVLPAININAATLLVGNKSEASVSLIDLESGLEVARARTQAGPHEIAVSGDGRLAVVTNYGDRQAGNSLSVIDVERGETVSTIDLGKYSRPHGIVFMGDGRRVLVTAEGAQALVVVDVQKGAVTGAIPTGQEVSHMLAYDSAAQRAYVANIGSGSVSLIDVAGGKLLSSHPSGKGAEGIALGASGRDIWVTNRAEDSVVRMDAFSGAVEKKIEVAGFPIRAEMFTGIAGRPEKLLVTSARSGTLSIIDPETAVLERTVQLGLSLRGEADGLFADAFGESSIPIGIEIEPGGGRIWIAHAGADAVQELDAATWGQLRLLKSGREPDAMAYSPLTVRQRPADQVGLSSALP
jgi:DNA-binding beta-propeller fold protein YncE